MSAPRSHSVDPAVPGLYHCVSRGDDLCLSCGLRLTIHACPGPLLIEAMQSTTPNCLAVLDTLEQIDSDHEALQVLTGLAQRMPNDAALIERYRAAARTLGSYERSEAEQTLDRFFES
jgi:hypothetical protein